MRLDAAFYKGDVTEVAPALVGKTVCRRLLDGSIKRVRITETEAYRGSEDAACHARFGRTKRTEMLCRRGGFTYIYLIYGLHWLMNVTTGSEGEPQAALLRAAEKPLQGPGKWTRALGIDGALNGLWLPDSDIVWLEDDGYRPEIVTAPRVGIGYAAEPWRSIAWRYIAKEK